MSIVLSLVGIVICGGIGGVAAWALVTATGIGGVTGALLAAVIAMAIAVVAWIAGTSLLRMLRGRR